MPKYVHSARSFYDEQEIKDVLSCKPPFNRKKLLSINLARGLILSREADEETLVAETARLHFSWFQFIELARSLDTAQKEEKRAVKRLGGSVSSDNIESAFKATKEKRSGSKGEVYSMRKTDDRTYVDVKYVHKDPTKAKNRQREERVVSIEVSETSNGSVELIYNQDDRALEVAAQLVSCLRAEKGDDDDIVEADIALPRVQDPAFKSKFFLEVLKNLDGLKHVGVLDVSLDCRLEAEIEGEDEEPLADEEDERTAEEDELVGRIKKAALSGDDVITTKLYSDLSQLGYYISSIKWESREKSGDKRKVVLEAGFRDPVKGKDFFFDAKKVYAKDDYGEDASASRQLILLERARLRRKISDSAFIALESLNLEPED